MGKQRGSRLRYGIIPVHSPQQDHYDAIVLAVAHKEFPQMGAEAIHALGKDNHVLFDIKYIFEVGKLMGDYVMIQHKAIHNELASKQHTWLNTYA